MLTASRLAITEATSDISLNTLEIDIKYTKLEYEGRTLSPTGHTYSEDIQTDKFSFGETLAAGSKATITIKYVGQLNDKMAGFYRSSYVENGETKYMATTQMEPTDARRVRLSRCQHDAPANARRPLLASTSPTSSRPGPSP